MTAQPRFDPPHDDRADSLSPDERAKIRHLLELELVKLRSEATAVRLEARATEIEMQIRQLDLGETFESSIHRPLLAVQSSPLPQPPLNQSITNQSILNQPTPNRQASSSIAVPSLGTKSAP
jgi:hypothetical protein